MKQKDIALTVVIIFISGIFSLIVSRLIISPSGQKQEVEVVEPITAEFHQPSEKFFNDRSVNPTQLIRIGENENKTPFDQ